MPLEYSGGVKTLVKLTQLLGCYMAKQIGVINIEIYKNDRKYVFSLPFGAPLGECYDACHDVLQEIIEMSKKASENAKQKPQESNPEIVNL